jgi:hypothetical protein
LGGRPRPRFNVKLEAALEAALGGRPRPRFIVNSEGALG